MIKKISLLFFILIVSFFSFIGCSDFINLKTKTDININLDLSKLIKTSRNNEDEYGNMYSAEYQLEVTKWEY